MTDKVIGININSEDAFLQTPEGALKSALEDIEVTGALRSGKKLLVIALDDVEGVYDISFYRAGMDSPQTLALLEAMKVVCLQEMLYIPEE